jgi:predicted transcriptional regulator
LSQKTILTALTNLYRETDDPIKGEDLAEEIGRNPGTVRNQMQGLTSLQLVGRVAKRSRVSSYGHVDYSAVLSLTLSKLRALGAHHSNAVFLFVLSTVGTLSGKL